MPYQKSPSMTSRGFFPALNGPCPCKIYGTARECRSSRTVVSRHRNVPGKPACNRYSFMIQVPGKKGHSSQKGAIGENFVPAARPRPEQSRRMRILLRCGTVPSCIPFPHGEGPGDYALYRENDSVRRGRWISCNGDVDHALRTGRTIMFGPEQIMRWSP